MKLVLASRESACTVVPPAPRMSANDRWLELICVERSQSRCPCESGQLAELGHLNGPILIQLAVRKVEH